MKGKILDYNFQESKGVISADDGNRYYFENSEWKGSVSPKANQVVDFEIDGTNAKVIYLVKTSVSLEDVADKLNVQEKIAFSKNKLEIIRKNGLQNKFGFIISIILLVSIFLPIISINLGFGIGEEVAIIDSTFGYITLLGIVISAFLFYSGGKQVFTKIAVVVVLSTIIIFFFSIYNNISALVELSGNRRISAIEIFANSLNLFYFVIIIVSAVLHVINGFKKSYKEVGVNNEG